jgi:hypothetical protein
MTCERTCASCAWWSNEEPTLATGSRRAAGADPEIGTCMIAPPVIVRLAGMQGSYFPETLASRGCGRWAANTDGGPDDGERVGQGGESEDNVMPFRRVAA